jgi:hypothetical protein
MVVREVADAAAAGAVTRRHARIVDSGSADRAAKGSAVNGTPRGEAAARTAVPGGQVPVGTDGHRSDETVEIAQRDFPGLNPLAGPNEPGRISAVERERTQDCRRGLTPDISGKGPRRSP